MSALFSAHHLVRTLILLLAVSWIGCRIYDADLLNPEPRSPERDGSMDADGNPRQDGALPEDAASVDLDADGSAERDACAKLGNESCNGLDDDCDEKIDEAIVACLPHAASRCVTGICVFQECLEGFCNCNGSPNDGCEVAFAEAPDVCLARCNRPTRDAGMRDASFDAGDGGLASDGGMTDSAPDAATSNPTLVTAINCAGDVYTSVDGLEYVADMYFTSSSTVQRHESREILGTSDDPIYRAERWSNDFAYEIPVENGTYRVLLQFAETYFDEVGRRTFDVELEGELVIDDLDIYAEVGMDAAYDRVFETTVGDGTLDVHLSSTANNAEINGIVVWRLP